MFDGTSNNVYYAALGMYYQVVANSSRNESEPIVSGDYIVYNDQYDIVLYNFFTGEIQKITDDAYAQKRAKISGDYIVWEDFHNMYVGEIFLYDMTDGETYALTNTGIAGKYVTDLDGTTLLYNETNTGTNVVSRLQFFVDPAPRVPEPFSASMLLLASIHFMARRKHCSFPS